MDAYKDVLERTSTKVAPWYVVPSDHSWYRDLVVCSVLVSTLEGLAMQYPPIPVGKRLASTSGGSS